MTTGILFGLGAAVFHSLCFLSTRVFVSEGRSAIRLLALGHIAMGLISLMVLPFIWPEDMPSLISLAGVLAQMVFAYMAGQCAIFIALRKSDASRVSPLLAIKIPVLAIIAIIFLNEPQSLLQWFGVATCVLAAYILSCTGGKLPWKSLVAIIFSAVCYAISDTNIFKCVKSMEEYLSKPHAIAFAMALTYVLCGIVGVALLPLSGKKPLKDLPRAIPFAISWLLAMVCLFSCFSIVGTVYGGILQSMRGIFSILLGVLLSHMGIVHLETRNSRDVVLKRLAATVLTCAAIGIYAYGKNSRPIPELPADLPAITYTQPANAAAQRAE